MVENMKVYMRVCTYWAHCRQETRNVLNASRQVAQYLCAAHHPSVKDRGTRLISAAKQRSDRLSDAPLLHLQDHFSSRSQTVSLTERKTNAGGCFPELQASAIFYLRSFHNPFILCSKLPSQLEFHVNELVSGLMEWTRCLIARGCRHWTWEKI